MKKGYRLSAPVVYYGYKQTKLANFAISPGGYGAIAGSVIGGLGGTLSTPENSSWVDRVGRGALGAGIGASLGAGLGIGAKYTSKGWKDGLARGINKRLNNNSLDINTQTQVL